LGGVADGSSRDVAAFARRLLDETREEILRADGKVSILFGAVVVASGIIVGSVTASGWNPRRLDAAAQSCWWVGTALAALSLLLLGAAVYPKIKLRASADGAARYFGDLARCRTTAEATAMVGAGSRDVVGRDIGQARVLAGIVVRKYRLTRLALWAFLVAGSLIVVSLALNTAY
jgi:hypothetical protein